MDWHILHCGSCVKGLFFTVLGFFLTCWYITWRFAWFFIALWHAIEAIALSAGAATVITSIILTGKLIFRWWRAGHPVPMPAFADLKARKLRVKPVQVNAADPEHVYVVTDATPGRKFNGMQG